MGVVIEGGHKASVGFGLDCWIRQIDACAIDIDHSFFVFCFEKPELSIAFVTRASSWKKEPSYTPNDCHLPNSPGTNKHVPKPSSNNASMTDSE
jgi:hypothetical protein